MSELRPYQIKAVKAAFDLIGSGKSGLLVLPTGSGKSHVIAEIVNCLSGKSIVLQPTKEILESNIDKIKRTGFLDVGIYSASMGIKEMGKATYATIGSIIKIADQIHDCEALIIDEAHLTNARGGQYLEFIKKLNPKLLIGTTATPYRLHSNSYGSQMKMLTRTRPKIWDDIVHITQSDDLIQQGFLHRPDYVISGHGDNEMLCPNTTGAEYSEQSIEFYFTKTRILTRIAESAEDAIARGLKHILIFVPSIGHNKKVIEKLAEKGISSDSISSLSTKQQREDKLRAFRSGAIRACINVGILGLGYDFPELDCVICARPTMSLALNYQQIGRSVRIHPEKPKVLIYDVVNNFQRFDDPLKMRVIQGSSGLHCVLSPKGRLTGRNLDEGPGIEDRIDFGKYKGKKLADVPTFYLQWYIGAAKRGTIWHTFDIELKRREIWGSKTEGMEAP